MKAKSGILSWLPPLVSLCLFGVALWVLHGMLRGLDLDDVLREFRGLSAVSVAMSAAIMVVSYFVLMTYDVLAISHIGKQLAHGKVLLAAFVGYVFSHNIGMSLVTGGGVRYRVYTAAGLTAFEIGAVTLLCGLTFTLGAMVIGGVALIFEPADLFRPIGLSHTGAQMLGIALLVAVAGWVIWSGTRKRELRLREFTMRAPPFLLSLKQIGVAILEITLSGLTLYVLLPKGYDVSFVVFMAVYVLATVGGILSHVPGGIGVIEATFLLLLPQIPQGPMLASILAFRVIYLIFPLFVGAMLLGMFEVAQQRHAMQRLTSWFGNVADRLVPAAVGSAVMVSAAYLLFSGARSVVPWRLDWLSANLPLAIVEISHVGATLAALGLLLLARPLFARLASAHRLAVILLGVGGLLALAKGLEFEEASVIGIVLAVLLLSQPAFKRRGSIFDQRYSAAWLVSIAVIVGAHVWLGLFSFKEAAFGGSVWWEFSFDGEAARFIRATAALVIGIAATVVLGRIHAAPRIPALADAQDLAEARRILQRLPAGTPGLIRPDLRYYFNHAGAAFLCFDIQERSWIALGDPVGQPDALSALAWNFRDLSESHGGQAVFLGLTDRTLSHYADIGLRPHVLGEEAIVPLGARQADTGPQMAAGLDFAVVTAAEISNIDGLIGPMNGDVGPRPAPDARCAIITASGAIVAFAVLHQIEGSGELRVGTVHAGANPVAGVLPSLLAGVAGWAQREGFDRINLGIAPPLDPSQAHPLQPFWERVGAVIFPHGRYFAGFAQLRECLQSFEPIWRPRYLVTARGHRLPSSIEDTIVWIEKRGNPNPLALV
ncbi:MAG: phosphatidylglycerol lysyltransferase domain-containing protein [Alphaproteobacteria bacterium]